MTSLMKDLEEKFATRGKMKLLQRKRAKLEKMRQERLKKRKAAKRENFDQIDVDVVGGRTIQLDPMLFPQDIEPELFKIEENRDELIYALYGDYVLKLFKMDKSSPGVPPELILNKKTSKMAKIDNLQSKLNKGEFLTFQRKIGNQSPSAHSKELFSIPIDATEVQLLPKTLQKLIKRDPASKHSKEAKTAIKSFIQVAINPQSSDFQKSYPSHLTIDSFEGFGCAINRYTATKKIQTVAKIDITGLTRAALIHHERLRKGQNDIIMNIFENKYGGLLNRVAKSDCRSFRLDSIQELFNLGPRQKIGQVAHIAMTFEKGTKVMLLWVHLRVKRVLRYQIVMFC